MKANGRVTIPTDLDVIKETLDIMDVWGADAIRDRISGRTEKDRSKDLRNLLHHQKR